MKIPSQPFSLQGKVALITGAGSGIGLAITERFLAAGAQVAMLDRTDIKALADSLGAWSIQADVSSESDLANAFAEVVAQFGTLDIVVNNAGIQPLGVNFEALTPQLMDRTFAVNVNGTALGMKHAAKYLKRGGRIINMGSFAGILGAPSSTAYGASKAAVIHLTKCAAIEFGSRGITVNCLCPGTVKTPAVMDIPDNPEISFVESRTPLGRLAEPEEIASCAHFLASDEASYVTGHALHCDGGIAAGWNEYALTAPDNVKEGMWTDA